MLDHLLSWYIHTTSLTINSYENIGVDVYPWTWVKATCGGSPASDVVVYPSRVSLWQNIPPMQGKILAAGYRNVGERDKIETTSL